MKHMLIIIQEGKRAKDWLNTLPIILDPSEVFGQRKRVHAT